jgi:hypothetical protein
MSGEDQVTVFVADDEETVVDGLLMAPGQVSVMQ